MNGGLPSPDREGPGIVTAAEWQHRFIGELRMRDVPGVGIGDAIAEVEAHCADAGQSPQEAFGDPIEYATRVAQTRGVPKRQTPVKVLRVSARVALMLAGILTTLAGADGVAHHRDAVVTAGSLLAVALGAIAIPVVVANLRLRGSWKTGMAMMVPALAAMMLPPLWKADVAHLPAGWALGCGLAVTAASYWPTGRSRLVDRIVDPRPGHEPSPVSPRATILLIAGVPLGVFLASVAAVLLLAR
ncbi:MAG: hypothetical protein HKP61_16960 [Dactylosporangium sp.]|nr:hypothetical protein [Dactylosporangium sp.]NNJ62598.1 hypothetical protein [Dactylosporangium sp.]